MTPEHRARLEDLARWHALEGFVYGVYAEQDRATKAAFHNGAAADIRAALVSIDDEMQNRLVRQHIKADRRKYEKEPVSITGFDQLQDQS